MDFQSIRLKLASPEEILKWSHGEVAKPETINYRTQKSEKDGLFCEKIFGPEKDWECYCGKYRRIRYKGIICDKCGVEVTRSIVRRERMGHISLAVPVSHIWFLRGVPSKMGTLLDLSVQSLEKVVYFASYIVTKIDEQAREQVFKEIDQEYSSKLKSDKSKRDELKSARDKAKEEVRSIHLYRVFSENEYRDLSMKYGEIFEAGTGAEAVRKIFEQIDLESLRKDLLAQFKNGGPSQKKVLGKLRMVEGMIKNRIRPEWMLLKVVPVIPPDLRPMVQLDGGRFATSDLNDLYRRVINRNNRLKRLIELKAPEVITRNEKRMLQEAVDSLIDNSIRRGQVSVMASTGQKRVLKSLADMLKGKQGRFRQNLLGKRVDYSGRSVIVVGPELKLHQCGLPKKMALELFRPFVIYGLIKKGLAHNIRGANRLIEEGINEVWDTLEEAIQNKYVLLNRAPTLHRLGIQAFQPVLIEGAAIQIHPLVCKAFNADFDGDQMAVHLPLSEEAQREARELMLSSNNLLKPATGNPIVFPTQDIVLGCYWMTKIKEGLLGENKYFSSPEEAVLAYQSGILHLKARIKVRVSKGGANEMIETCVGRIIFNNILPPEIPFVNEELIQKKLEALTVQIIDVCGIKKGSAVLDDIKKLGNEFSTKSGVSWGMDDLKIPLLKSKIIQEAEEQSDIIVNQYNRGLLTDEERKAKIIEIWKKVMDDIAKEVPKSQDAYGSVFTIVDSKARGSWFQITQMAGIKGLVSNPAGEIIELPVKSSFKEGFNILEYFNSTHGARKGASDTALRTASAGYLTRRLVDVSQDVIVKEEDCGDKDGIFIYREDGDETHRSFASRIVGRVGLLTLKHPESGKVLVKQGEIVDKSAAKEIENANFDKIRARSVITCKTLHGVCQKCYGYDLGDNQLVRIGQAVGIVTAQAIGEPGTQLTMRTFHTGGVAGGGDMTRGLPRAEEIFECRVPKGQAIISEFDGVVKEIIQQKNQRIVRILPKEIKKKSKKEKIREYAIPFTAGILVEKGDLVVKGQQLHEGHINLKELFRLAGHEAVQRYIIKEIQNIYSSEGADINDKHIEVIIRQMFSRVKILDSGDTSLVPGVIVEKDALVRENQKAEAKKGSVATAQALLMGITRVALTTESFLAAASFQETTRVLINAAIEGREDKLRALKENVIVGRLIPAGTGFKQ